MSEIPTLREELDRKVLETFSWLVSGNDNGLVSDEELSFGMDVLFKAAWGLMDKDFTQMFECAQESLKSKNKRIMSQAVFRRNEYAGAVVVVKWEPTSCIVEMTRMGLEGVAPIKKELDSPKLAKAYFEGICSKLSGPDWTRL